MDVVNEGSEVFIYSTVSHTEEDHRLLVKGLIACAPNPAHSDRGTAARLFFSPLFFCSHAPICIHTPSHVTRPLHHASTGGYLRVRSVLS